MFTHMNMKNFKSWLDTGDIPLASLTGFFGTNSSGKSSLLQMLLLLKQTAESSDRGLILKTGSIQEGYVNLGTAHEITHRDTEEMTIGLTWENPKPIKINTVKSLKTIHYEANLRATSKETQVISLSYKSEGFEAVMQHDTKENYKVRVTVDGKEPKLQPARPFKYISKPIKCYGFSDEALRYYQDAEYLQDIVYQFEQQFQNLYYLGPLREYPQRIYTWGGETPTGVGLKGELAIPALLAGKGKGVYGKGNTLKLEKRIAQWLVEMGLAESFRTRAIQQGGVQYEVRIKRHKKSHEVLITDLGFGVSQILPVLVLCYYAPIGATIILEQPEIHLHPSVQSALADVFIDVIKRRNIQLIIESHSEHLLRRLQRRIAEQELTPQETALYFCDSSNGVSHIQPLEIDTFGNIRNWPQEFFGDLTGDLFAMAQTGIKRQMSNGNK
jgi:predicted ATPase